MNLPFSLFLFQFTFLSSCSQPHFSLTCPFLPATHSLSLSLILSSFPATITLSFIMLHVPHFLSSLYLFASHSFIFLPLSPSIIFSLIDYTYIHIYKLKYKSQKPQLILMKIVLNRTHTPQLKQILCSTTGYKR